MAQGYAKRSRVASWVTEAGAGRPISGGTLVTVTTGYGASPGRLARCCSTADSVARGPAPGRDRLDRTKKCGRIAPPSKRPVRGPVGKRSARADQHQGHNRGHSHSTKHRTSPTNDPDAADPARYVLAIVSGGMVACWKPPVPDPVALVARRSREIDVSPDALIRQTIGWSLRPPPSSTGAYCTCGQDPSAQLGFGSGSDCARRLPRRGGALPDRMLARGIHRLGGPGVPGRPCHSAPPANTLAGTAVRRTACCGRGSRR